MKFRLLPIALVFCSLPSGASGLPNWVDSEAAIAYAEAALIEWSNQMYAPVDRTRLNHRPAVLGRAGSSGNKIVLVVYEAAHGSYVVTLTVDQDGLLQVFGRGGRVDRPHEVIEEFYAPDFDPSSILQEG